MPKLLQIDSCLGIYSTGRITEGIATKAIQRGWECYIAHGARYVGKTIQKPYQITSRNNEYVHYALSVLLDSHGLHSTKMTKNLVRWIDEVNPDVINLHCIHGYYLNYKVLFEYLSQKNIPVVWTFHDCWAFTGHCAHFVSVDCNKWKEEGCHDCPLKMNYPTSILDKSSRNYKLKKSLFLSLRNMEIVSVSKWLDGLVKESFFKDVQNHIIYNGIDTDTFKPRDSNRKKDLDLEGKIILLAVASSWSKEKGLQDYVALSNKLPYNYRIVLVGVSKKMAQSLPEGIISLPRTNNAIELAEYYSMADIVLNLSYQETFGLTTVEAMACGTPGIVYDRTASPELVSEETGMIVHAGDIDMLFDRIKIICTNGKNKYSSACRNRVLELFSQEDKYNEYINLYEQIISNKSI